MSLEGGGRVDDRVVDVLRYSGRDQQFREVLRDQVELALAGPATARAWPSATTRCTGTIGALEEHRQLRVGHYPLVEVVNDADEGLLVADPFINAHHSGVRFLGSPRANAVSR
jgi:hypothetical protein